MREKHEWDKHYDEDNLPWDTGMPDQALINLVTGRPMLVLFASAILVAIGMWPANKLGSEFMPDLDEGDLLYMPSTFPAVSAGK